MVYLLHVLVELLLWDLLLLGEPARLLEELEPAGRDGGDDLRGAQPSAEGASRSLPSLRLLSLTHPVPITSLLSSPPPFLNPMFRFLSNSLDPPESAGHGGKSWELDTRMT